MIFCAREKRYARPSNEWRTVFDLILSSKFQWVLKSRVERLTFEFSSERNYWICGFLLGKERNVPAIKDALWKVTAYIQKPLSSVKKTVHRIQKEKDSGTLTPRPPPLHTHHEVNPWVWTEHCRCKIIKNKEEKNERKNNLIRPIDRGTASCYKCLHDDCYISTTPRISIHDLTKIMLLFVTRKAGINEYFIRIFFDFCRKQDLLIS